MADTSSSTGSLAPLPVPSDRVALPSLPLLTQPVVSAAGPVSNTSAPGSINVVNLALPTVLPELGGNVVSSSRISTNGFSAKSHSRPERKLRKQYEIQPGIVPLGQGHQYPVQVVVSRHSIEVIRMKINGVLGNPHCLPDLDETYYFRVMQVRGEDTTRTLMLASYEKVYKVLASKGYDRSKFDGMLMVAPYKLKERDYPTVEDNVKHDIRIKIPPQAKTERELLGFLMNRFTFLEQIGLLPEGRWRPSVPVRDRTTGEVEGNSIFIRFKDVSVHQIALVRVILNGMLWDDDKKNESWGTIEARWAKAQKEKPLLEEPVIEVKRAELPAAPQPTLAEVSPGTGAPMGVVNMIPTQVPLQVPVTLTPSLPQPQLLAQPLTMQPISIQPAVLPALPVALPTPISLSVGSPQL